MGDFDRAARLAAEAEPEVFLSRLERLAQTRFRFLAWSQARTWR